MDKIITIENLQFYHNKLSQLLDGYAKLENIPSTEYCTNDDIYRLFNTNIPETTDAPEQPSVIVGSITNDNSIVIDETQLENGVYTLKYIDSNNNIISNFNDITTFEINN